MFETHLESVHTPLIGSLKLLLPTRLHGKLCEIEARHGKQANLAAMCNPRKRCRPRGASARERPCRRALGIEHDNSPVGPSHCSLDALIGFKKTKLVGAGSQRLAANGTVPLNYVRPICLELPN